MVNDGVALNTDAVVRASAPTLVECRVCGWGVTDGYAHLRAQELDPAHAIALARTSWQSLISATLSPR